jgi:hypothetical protein
VTTWKRPLAEIERKFEELMRTGLTREEAYSILVETEGKGPSSEKK